MILFVPYRVLRASSSARRVFFFIILSFGITVPVYAQSLQPPVLQSPSDNASGVSITPTLEWNLSTGAESYLVEVADGSFSESNIKFKSGDLSKTTTSVRASGLSYGKTYSWRVTAKKSGQSKTSGAWQFTVETGIPSVPSLDSPSNGATNVSISPELKWRSVAGATSYSLQYTTDKEFKKDVSLNEGINDTSFTATDLSSNTKYYWQVRAKGPGGYSGWSGAWEFTTGVGRPAVPTLKEPSNGDTVSTSPTLSWNSVNGAKSYKLEVSLNSDVSKPFEKAEKLTATSYSLGTKLDNNKKYYWHVKAVNGDGESNWSGAFSFTTQSGKPNAPALISPSSGTTVPLNGTLQWSVVTGAKSYDVQIDTDDKFVKPGGGTVTAAFYQLSGLESGKKYYWRVRVTTDGGTSDWSSAWSFTTTSGKVVAPKLNKPENNARGVSVNTSLDWEVISGATYDVEVADDNDFKDRDIISSGKGLRTATFAPTELKYSKTYYWHVKATMSNGTSDWSDTRSFTTGSGKLAAPNLLKPDKDAKNQSTTLTFDWSSVDGARSYGFEIATDEDFKKDKRRSDLTIPSATVSGLLPSTTYYWRVQSKDSTTASDWSEVRSFTTTSNRLAVPELTEPKNKVEVSVSPTLSWKEIKNALTYDVQIATDDKFNSKSVVMEKIGITGTLIQASGLSSKTTYYWRVRATNLQGSGEWSSPWEFKTHSSRLSAPVPVGVEPSIGGKTSTAPTLIWTSVANAISYILQYSTDKDFKKSVTEINGIKTASYALSGLSPKETYYWRVSARDSSESSEWSKIGNFETGDNRAPRPELVDPPDKATGVSANPTLSWALPKSGSTNTNQIYTYNLQLSKDKEFNGFVVKESNIRTTSFEVKKLELKETYYWRVSVADTTGSGEWSDVWRFTVGSDSLALTAPKLIAPEDGASGVSTHPLLSWDIVKSAKTYNIQVATDKEFKREIVVDTSNVRITSLEVKKGLKTKETYYWRVSAADSNRTSGWSERWDFETGSGKLSAPALLFPSDEAKGVSVNPTLSWKTSAGAVSYNIQLSTDKNFKRDIIESDSIRVTSWEVKGLDLKTEYYWRVSASGSTSTSDWSSEWSFTTGSSRLAAPVLVAPSNDAVGVSISPTFTWTDVKEASQYNLQYSTEKDFKKDFVEVNGLKGTSYRVSLLSTKEKYYWRVQSKDSTAVSDWSDVWSFNTGTSILATPELVSPQDNAEVETSLPLSWNSSSGAKLYALQVSTDVKFRNFVVDEEKLAGTSFTVNGLAPKKKYYWRVQALKDAETSEWSSAWKFEAKVTTAVENRESGAPSEFKLSPNFPNPFNPSTTIEFSIPKSGSVKIVIYNILGNLIATLVDQHLSAGTYRTQWNASGVASGVYFYQIQANGFIETKRLMLLK